jgi:hypothetical protein
MTALRLFLASGGALIGAILWQLVRSGELTGGERPIISAIKTGSVAGLSAAVVWAALEHRFWGVVFLSFSFLTITVFLLPGTAGFLESHPSVTWGAPLGLAFAWYHSHLSFPHRVASVLMCLVLLVAAWRVLSTEPEVAAWLSSLKGSVPSRASTNPIPSPSDHSPLTATANNAASGAPRTPSVIANTTQVSDHLCDPSRLPSLAKVNCASFEQRVWKGFFEQLGNFGSAYTYYVYDGTEPQKESCNPRWECPSWILSYIVTADEQHYWKRDNPYFVKCNISLGDCPSFVTNSINATRAR